ncbi:hypothetical protein ACSU1N_06455 [Thermogladius sp. 4427co]
MNRTTDTLPIERRFREYSDDTNRAIPDKPIINVAGAASIRAL